MGDFVQDARSWKLNFGLRDGKLRLRVPDTKPNKLRLDRTVKAALELRQVRLLVLSVGVGTANTRNKTGAATTASDQRLDVLFKSWSWSNMHMVPTFNELEARKLPAVRLSDQTWRRHASGVRRVCRHVFQISAKLWIIQKKIKMSPVGQDLRESVLCRGRRVRSGELRLRAQRARRSSPRRLGNTSNNTLVPPPRRSSRYLLSPPFVLREKSPGDDAEAQQPLSCSFVPTRTCQLINCASRLCAAPQLLCPISARLLLYSL